jgi:hypothetical protein
MDYLVLSTLIGVELLLVVLSYDIGCQWSKNLQQRVLEFPEDMRLDANANIEVKVPNWHINGHGEFCRTHYSSNYLKGAGRTCGEDVETSWVGTNPLGPSVRELGPASRHELLNDQWNGWNFQKIVGFRMFYPILYSCLLIIIKVNFSQSDSRMHLTCERNIVPFLPS